MADNTLTTLRSVLEALQSEDFDVDTRKTRALLTDLNQLIASMEAQEPVAYHVSFNKGASWTVYEFKFKPSLVSNPDVLVVPLYTHPAQPKAEPRLTDAEIKAEFGKLYPNDLPLIELAANNRDFALEAIGARHHWTAFKEGARAIERKVRGDKA
jgi:hypothetical protein